MNSCFIPGLLLFFRLIWYNGVMKELTVDLAYRELQQILQDKVLLVVGTGASMALDRRFGMGALSKKPKKKIPGHTLLEESEVLGD